MIHPAKRFCDDGKKGYSYCVPVASTTEHLSLPQVPLSVTYDENCTQAFRQDAHALDKRGIPAGLNRQRDHHHRESRTVQKACVSFAPLLVSIQRAQSTV